MGLFGKSKEDKEREKVKSNIDKMMDSYSKGEIDGDTYFKQMMDYTTSYRDNKKKKDKN